MSEKLEFEAIEVQTNPDEEKFLAKQKDIKKGP